jgi:hypothetical protein
LAQRAFLIRFRGSEGTSEPDRAPFSARISILGGIVDVLDEQVYLRSRVVGQVRPVDEVEVVAVGRGDDPERAAGFRAALRDAVAAADRDNLHLVDGPDLMDATGLTTALIHPGAAGVAAIADGLAEAMDGLVGE